MSNDTELAEDHRKPKDVWDKAKLILSVLTPVTLALLGFYVTHVFETRDKDLRNAQLQAERRSRLNEGIVGQLDDISAALYAEKNGGAYDLAPRIAAITQIAVLAQATDPAPPSYFYTAVIGLLTEYIRQNAPKRRVALEDGVPHRSGPLEEHPGLTVDIRTGEPPRYRAVDIVWALRALQEVRLTSQRVTGQPLPVPLTSIDFRYLSLAETPGLDLSGFDFTHSDFTGAFLSRCICRNTSFHHAILDGVVVWNADFHGADFRRAALRDSRWENVNLSGSQRSTEDKPFTTAVGYFGSANTGSPTTFPEE